MLEYSFNSSMANKKQQAVTEEMVEQAVESVFKKYDQNNNNFIDFPEFCKMIGDLKLSVSISLREMNIIFELLDYDGDGKVSRDELIEGFLAIKSPDS